MIEQCRQSLRRVRRVLLQAPTGFGKTALATFMTGETAAKGQGVWFICHRAELVDGTSKTFAKYGITHSFIAAGRQINLKTLVQICSIDTLKNRLATLVAPKIALIDEGHHCAAAGWAVVIDWLVSQGCYVILLSATPKRLDGKPIRLHCDEMVLGPQVAELIAEGSLAQYQAFIPDVPDMKGVRKMMGDFKKADAAERMDKPKLTGNIIKHWKKYANGLKTIGFAVNVAHSQHLAESFRVAGIKAEHLDGTTDKAERKRIIMEFAHGDLDVLFNVDLFSEGFDLSAIAETDVTVDCVIDASPSQSLVKVMQRWGRALRPGLVKIKIILDHAGNMLRHGFPDDPREWSLDGDEETAKGANDNGPPPPVICEGCFNAIRRPLPPCCPYCEKSLQAKQKEIEVAEGELRAVDEKAKESVRAKLKREMDACKDLGALTAYFAKQGVANPAGRANVEFGSRRYRKR
jgi:superfamily II DNA or RNA helicase